MEKVIKEETAKIKKAFEEWAERNGFKVIRCQYDMKLGTCRLFRRRGKFYIEVGSELTKAQDAIIKRAGIERNFAYSYPMLEAGPADALEFLTITENMETL